MEFCDRRLTTSKTRLANIEHPNFINPYWSNMNVSNVQVSSKGKFMHVGNNTYKDRQGLWSNHLFNSSNQEKCKPVETYSNLQGAWSRVGPSTYDSLHSYQDPYNRWAAGNFLPPTVKSLYDHRNVDPKGMWHPRHQGIIPPC